MNMDIFTKCNSPQAQQRLYDLLSQGNKVVCMESGNLFWGDGTDVVIHNGLSFIDHEEMRRLRQGCQEAIESSIVLYGYLPAYMEGINNIVNTKI